MNRIISVRDLKKGFGTVRAVDGISFEVREGELFAFLGQNGAGKSTTMNILCTLLGKDEGRVEIAGLDLDKDPSKIRSEIGVVFQGSVLDKELNVRDNLALRATYYGLYGAALKTRMVELIGLFDLEKLLKRPYGKLSGGERRRVDIARALLHEPRILFLDEPTTGLDPHTRRTVWVILEKLRKEKGITLFLTTHYMEETNKADYVVILDSGKISAEGSPVELKSAYSSDFLRIYADESAEWDKRLGGNVFTYSGGAYHVRAKGSFAAKALIGQLDAYIRDFEVVKGDMDDVFLNVTGKTLAEVK